MPRWISSWQMFRKIRFKIFAIILVSMLTVALSLGLIAYRYVTDLLTERQLNQMRSYANRQFDQLERILSDIRLPLTQLAARLAETDRSPEAVSQTLNMYRYSLYPFSRGIYFVSPNGSIYEAEGKAASGARLPRDAMKKLADGARTARLSLQTDGPYQSQGRGLVLTVASGVYIGTDLQGLIASDLDLRQMNALIAGMNPDPAISTLLLDEGGRPILSSIRIDQSAYSELYPGMQKLLKQQQTGIFALQAGSDDYVLLLGAPTSQNWHLVSFVRKRDILAPVDELQGYALLLILFFILLSLAFSFFLARYIDGPISGLAAQMRQVREGQLSLRIRLKRSDEFLALADSFNDMLDRIEELIEERVQDEKTKKQYELRALQAQINPHFLYNTLNSINALVDLKRTEEVPKVLNALVHLLQYSMGRGESLTTLAEELEGLKHYVYLQQIRYQHKFEVEFEIGGNLLDFRIPKLTLQPILENAIFHGIKEKRRGEGKIVVGGSLVAANTLRLFIKDNGTGILPERLKRLLLPGEEPPSPSGLLPNYSSLGLRNVHERLQLHYGSLYGLQIDSEPGEGTSVFLTIPAQTGGETHESEA